MKKPLEWIRQGECIVCVSHCRINTGYSVIRRKKKTILLHRLVCERKHGPLGELVAMHACDNPACISPAHLSPGTFQDNMKDMHAKGRANTPLGSQNGKAKLGEAKAAEIFLATGSHRSIAKKFGTDHRTVGRIKRREAWAHINK